MLCFVRTAHPEWYGGAIRDPADRALVATAGHLYGPPIRSDVTIQDGLWVDTVWALRRRKTLIDRETLFEVREIP